MSTRNHEPRKRLIPTLAGLAALSLLAAGCAPAAEGDNGGSDGSEGPTEFSFLTVVESPQIRDELTRLSKNQCAEENEALPLAVETIPQADVNQKVSLLASQGALPVMFVSPTTESRVGGDMYEAGKLLDLEKALKDVGAWEDVRPAAAATVKSIYGDMVSLPFQYNIEGFWYNKEIFAENGIEVPTTWEEFTQAASTLKSAGVQPLTAAGSQGWTITRYISTYLARAHGSDALDAVKSGDAAFTDPDYLVAAQELAELGANGYFGQGVASRDMNTMLADFLGGTAGMMYDGSWVLSNIADEEENKIGTENIGFFPFPAVENGEGNINDYPANTGTVTAVNKALYNDDVGAWLGCIAKNYGSSLLANQGAISGFAQNEEVEGVPRLVAEVNQRMDKAKEPVQWLEAPFNSRFADAAGLNAGTLLTGGISPEDYMSKLQSSLGSR